VVVRRGTWPVQRCVEGTLADIAQRVAEAGLQPPAVTVVGAVAELRDSLNWFETRPLFGRRVVVTRARTQASELSELLAAAGAEVIELPVIAVAARDVGARVKELVADGLPYEWVVFTSINAVELFFAALDAQGADSRLLGGCQVGAVGPATAEALRAHGLRADFVPRTFSAADFVAEFPAAADQRVLFPCASAAGDTLVRELTAQGGRVDALPLYDTVPDTTDVDAVRARFIAGDVDAVTFTSSSTARNFRALLPEVDLSRVCLASIGPKTGATLAELGLTPTLTAGESRIEALVEALIGHFGGR
jgi:uroporphyrinogen III methyltransferase/synthase